MASHRRPKQPNRTRVTVLTATAAAAVALTSQAAHASPKPTTAQVKARVDKLYDEAEVATEKYDGAKEQQGGLQKEVDALQDKVARGQDQLNTLRDALGSVAAAQYRTAGIDPSIQLLLSAHPDDYLDQATTLDQVSAQQADALQQIQLKQRSLAQDREEAQEKIKDLSATRKALGENKEKVQAKLASARKLLNSLTAADRAAVLGNSQRASRDGGRPDLGTVPPASSRAAAALAAAKNELGKPYVYGATGPGSFDCSGLTSYAYAQAGVAIPRTSEAQANAGPHLSMSQLRPGDLVIFYGDAHHVGLYAGNGMVLHAPKPGAFVRYEAMSNMPFQFGVRIA